MNAAPMLTLVAERIARHRLDVVMIGNAAAALQGSPVTTMDVHFMFRKTSRSLRKLEALAVDLDAMVMRPFYRASQLYRVVRDRDGLQLDFMARVDGVRSFEAMRARAACAVWPPRVARGAVGLATGERSRAARADSPAAGAAAERAHALPARAPAGWWKRAVGAVPANPPPRSRAQTGL